MITKNNPTYPGFYPAADYLTLLPSKQTPEEKARYDEMLKQLKKMIEDNNITFSIRKDGKKPKPYGEGEFFVPRSSTEGKEELLIMHPRGYRHPNGKIEIMGFDLTYDPYLKEKK